MKKHNQFAIISLVSLLVSCGDDKKNAENLFSIDDSQFKAMYHKDDHLNLTIKNNAKKTIDSIVYFNNDAKIGTAKGNAKFDFALASEKLGYQNLKAVVYYEGEQSETETRIEMVSTIEPKQLNYSIVGTFPHDITAFTEGFEFYNGDLFESTGQKGASNFRKTDPKTGKVLQQVNLQPQYFGEGITFVNGKLFQLTWQEKTGFIYDATTLKLEKSFAFDKNIEGWGMTNDKKFIYQSDGTEKIWKMNPENQKMVDFVNVYTNATKVTSINELEWINGKIYANIWQKDIVLIINPQNGAVEAFLDLSDLRKKTNATADDVLNGIAYNPKTQTIFVTGKNWDKTFEIKVK
ncbi:glutaminyl-peptide cyclotransferase [Flavobacterium humi]|uniref:Glutaminyl-peptide cyclotransferase n=1 Tax=Flavobacterium humi TaxID=2562683 RepID=A0A4Z0LCW2_9FLAO|nr:glutaminyl-peptide cyclotransferase [Flavobacterium humi]TGD59726.1 glutaminyl-peptide cyclotransferase [Flavobacterium humi]